MKVYRIEEIAEILEFNLYMNRAYKGEKFPIYRKENIFNGKKYSYELSKSPPNIGLNEVYRFYKVVINDKGITEKLNLRFSTLEGLNEYIITSPDFKKTFRDSKINKILNSDE